MIRKGNEKMKTTQKKKKKALKTNSEIEPASRLFRRKRIMIKKKEQVYFALLSTTFILATNLWLWYLIEWIYRDFYQKTGTFPPDIQAYGFIISTMIVVNGLVVFGLVLYFLRRLMGPIHRIEKAALDLMANGEAKIIKTRKHDLLQDTIKIMNELISWFSKQKVLRSPR